MKLFVIVLCLLSERYLIHSISFKRFEWFDSYYDSVLKSIKSIDVLSSPWMKLLSVLIPLLATIIIVLYLFSSLIFGLFGLLLNVAIFYYCLGPQNPFYPVIASNKTAKQSLTKQYFIDINHQLVAVTFWYITGGPVAALTYRVIYLCQNHKDTKKEASMFVGILDWVPARITALGYLLVGHFQNGKDVFIKHVFSSTKENNRILSECGIASAGHDKKSDVSITKAEVIVEHTVILFLVLLALLTLIAWL